MLRVGLTGGIGSGKSTVCRMFTMLGVPVYDSDFRAKFLMNNDKELIDCIELLLGLESYRDGVLDRVYVADKVFSDRELLQQLNGLVHPAVRADFRCWCRAQNASYVVMESAILFESSLMDYLDLSVVVSAPQELRIKRTCARDGVSPQRVVQRISNQMSEMQREQRADHIILNDDKHLLWEQVLELDKKLRG